MPNLHWSEVIVPPQNVNWLVSLPEQECDTTHVQEELPGMRQLSHGPDPEWVLDSSNIRRNLKSHMAEIFPEVFNEVEIAFSHALGQPKTWTHMHTLDAEDANNGCFVTAAHISDKFLPFVLGKYAWYVSATVSSPFTEWKQSWLLLCSPRAPNVHGASVQDLQL